MSTNRQHLLDSVARAVSDGQSVDWSQAASAAPDVQTREVLQHLRVVEKIADLHRKTAQEAEGAVNESSRTDGSRRPGGTPPGVRPEGDVWAHLTLCEVIGRGAYGIVYRAWEPRLDRDVALKLMPEALAHQYADLVIEEARLMARVHHPNIITVYGAAREDGCVGLWMELIEGQTLEQILQERGRFSAREAALVGLDVCEALAAVHSAGLLHRDVKAHNVMRDRNGRIVLMDFGAGREQTLPGETPIADLAGTPLYMAPELFQGKEASVRSDVYSVGVLLYRLVTGKVPVTARSLDEVRKAHENGQVRHLRDERSDLPGSFVHIVERALSPDPARRFDSAGAFEMALTGLLTATSEGAHALGESRPRHLASAAPRHPSWPWLAAGALLLALVAFVGFWYWQANSLPRAGRGGPQARFILYPPLSTEFESFDLSPDGRTLAFTAAGQLWTRALDSLEATRFTDTQGSHDPFWSPDGHSIAFFKGVSLWIVSSAGGGPRPVCAARNASGGAWGPDGTILFAADFGQAIYRVTVQTGERQPLRQHGVHGFNLQWPSFLPSGRGFIYSGRQQADGPRGILVGSFDSSPDRWLMATESNARLSGGRLLFVRDGSLMAQMFDEGSGRLSGEPVRVADRVPANLYVRSDYANFSVAHDPTEVMAYLGGARLADRQMTIVARDGSSQTLIGPGEYRDLALSHSGRELAYEERDSETGRRDIWIIDIDRRQPRRLTSAPFEKTAPVWSADDRFIYFLASRNGKSTIYRRAVDGTGQDEEIYQDRAELVPFDFTSDGQMMTYTRLDLGRDSDIWVMPTANAAAAQGFRASEFRENEPRFSPDGKWMTYSSTESSSRQVYIENVAVPGPRWQVSMKNGREPQWRADGRELFFHGPDRMLMASTVDLSVSPPRIGAPQPLFELKFRGWDTRYHYAVLPDGRRFIVNQPVEGSQPVPITVVMNWTSH
jgi:Tol biopolymer transport system component